MSDRPVAEVGLEARHLDLAREQLALLLHVLDRVAGEALERLADLLPALLGEGEHPLRVLRLAAGDHLTAGTQHVAAAQHDRVPVVEQVEERRRGRVDQVDARLHEEERAHVRVVTAGRGRAVDHALDPACDEVLGGDPVEVQVVDDGDVAGP